ncbi:hypothetical protein [Agilicoccus flavus]|uniref:hypothetical protein n=1 Tax=Agilicoccus flavus TaxID=2775968 RepID=UPI001CF65595|nr:hypothetical protein [Agilicoccus flavus]
MVTQEALEAADRLDIQPRQQRWRSATYCVLDAVWSIGANYDAVVAPLVKRVADACGDAQPLTPEIDAPGPDPTPLIDFRSRFPSPESLLEVTHNRQRTSSTSGIPKTEAVLRYCDTLLENDVVDLASAQKVLTDAEKQRAVTAKLQEIPGSGVREGYFWMLVGSNDLVKPDRQVLRWLREHGIVTDVAGARTVLAEIARELSDRRGLPVTPWELDNAIWRAVSRSSARY